MFKMVENQELLKNLPKSNNLDETTENCKNKKE